MTAKIHHNTATRAIKLLRKEKLAQGLTFMINSDLLPTTQCYLEYPDGSIKIVEANAKDVDFKIIEVLDYLNVEVLKRNLKLI